MSRWMREEKLSWMGDNSPLNRAGVCLHLVIRGAAVGEGGGGWGRMDVSSLLPQAGSRGAPDGIRAPPLSPTSKKMMSADLPERRSLLRPVATATVPFSPPGRRTRQRAVERTCSEAHGPVLASAPPPPHLKTAHVSPSNASAPSHPPGLSPLGGSFGGNCHF